ncbi:hypothetical protein [Sulfurivermis fontis]|uniref:hypothetical protein n=1 Tax=Sulfurivermis fontis TaxID=1972068 RepID=UPI000FD792C4|nr:hypothetical protein [Sulfurivermis fontis]
MTIKTYSTPAIGFFLGLVIGVFAAPANGETHASEEVVQFLAAPPLTIQQRALLREMAQDPYLDSRVSSFFGLTPSRLANQSGDTQACLAAQYIVFQDVSRSRPPKDVLHAVRDMLKRHDWCEPVVKAFTDGQTVGQVLSYDGLVSLFYVLSTDMGTRIDMLVLSEGRQRPN